MSNVQTAVSAYKDAFNAALAKAPTPKELPQIQQDAIREKVRRESAREVDVAIRTAAFSAFLPEQDAAVLASAYPRLSLKHGVVKAACEAYAAGHGLDLARIDAAIDKAMNENAPDRKRDG